MSKEVKHKRINNDYNLVSNFKHLSKSVVYYVQNNQNVYYNIDENIVFNSCFSEIGKFNEYGYALGKITLPTPTKKYYVFCYVNELGEVISPLVNTYDYTMLNTDLDTYLEILQSKLAIPYTKKLIKE